MVSLRLALFAALGLCTLPSPAHAGGTRSHEVVDFGDFDAGETEGAAIESIGRVTVGYDPRRVELDAMTAFGCLGTSDAVFVATADQAGLVRLAPTRKTRKGNDAPKAEPFAKLDGVLVSAVAQLPGGDLVAATLPGGKLHRIDGRGRISPFAELKVEQIWALRVHQSRLLAATGPKGELWSLDLKGGDAKIILDAADKDLLSLEVVGNAILVGTAPSAHLLQVGDAIEGILLHEFAGEEVRALAVTKRGLFAAVNDFADRKLSGLDALTKQLARTSLVGQPPSGSKSAEASPPSADGALWHVDLGPQRDVARAAEAPWEKWLARDKQYFTSILADGDTVLVGSSEGGKIYRVAGARSYATVADAEERQTTGLCRVGRDGPIFATTGHGAAAYQLDAAPASKARYRSEVLDAGHPARYGAVVVRGSGTLRLRARSGPTADPDDRWGAWSTIDLQPSGDGRRGTLTALPQRRYVQLEFTLAERSAQLRSFEVFYAPENVAPLLQSVDVQPPQFDGEDDAEPKPTLTIQWEAKARDEDKLSYEVRIRPEGAEADAWVPLHHDEILTKPEFKLDLASVPDGVYEVAVRASDEPSNGSAHALFDELVSAPFVIDRQRPVIQTPVVQGLRVRAEVTDRGGYIYDVSYSIDGGPFRKASVEDGLLDGPREVMVFDLPSDLRPGNHRVVLRARDSFGNLATTAIVVRAKTP